jgi:hypothetical protein
MTELSIQAPEGAEFVYDEVKTERGQKSLGEWPLLVWRDVEAARIHYGDDAILDILAGRVQARQAWWWSVDPGLACRASGSHGGREVWRRCGRGVLVPRASRAW